MRNPFPFKPNWQYLMFVYVLFAAGFFFPVWDKLHNHYYYLAVAYPFAFTLTRERMQNLWQSSIFRLAIIYAGMVTFSVLWASPPELHKLPKDLFDLFYLTTFIALTMELVRQVRSFPDTVIKTVMASTTLLVPVTVLFFYHDHPWSVRLEGFERLENPNSGSALYGMVALLCLHVAVQRDRFSTVWRIHAVMCGTLCLVYVALTQSRGPVVALFIAGLLYAALHGYRKVLLAILCLLLVAGFAFYTDILPLELLISRGLSYRPEIWLQALPAIMQNPWFGNGASFDQVYHLTNHPDVYSHTHSALVASLLFVGIVGTSILAGLIAQTVWYAFRTKNYLAISLLTYAIVFLLISGYKIVNNPKIEWLYFWFPIALIAAEEIRFKHRFLSQRN